VLPLPALLLAGLAAEARSSTPGAPAAFARYHLRLKLTVLLHAAAARVAAPEADRQLQADGITKLLQIMSQLLCLLSLELLLRLLRLCSSHVHAAAAAAAASFSAGRMRFTLYWCRRLCEGSST
jgi:hypothetical protein